MVEGLTSLPAPDQGSACREIGSPTWQIVILRHWRPRRDATPVACRHLPDAYNPGDSSGEATPVPIPNTEVKLSSAEDTERAAFRENRSSPGLLHLTRLTRRPSPSVALAPRRDILRAMTVTGDPARPPAPKRRRALAATRAARRLDAGRRGLPVPAAGDGTLAQRPGRCATTGAAPSSRPRSSPPRSSGSCASSPPTATCATYQAAQARQRRRQGSARDGRATARPRLWPETAVAAAGPRARRSLLGLPAFAHARGRRRSCLDRADGRRVHRRWSSRGTAPSTPDEARLGVGRPRSPRGADRVGDHRARPAPTPSAVGTADAAPTPSGERRAARVRCTASRARPRQRQPRDRLPAPGERGAPTRYRVRAATR